MGRPPKPPTALRSIRLPVTEWQRLEREAQAAKTSVNAIVAARVKGEAPSPEPETATPEPKPRTQPAKPAPDADPEPPTDTGYKLSIGPVSRKFGALLKHKR